MCSHSYLCLYIHITTEHFKIHIMIVMHIIRVHATLHIIIVLSLSLYFAMHAHELAP